MKSVSRTNGKSRRPGHRQYAKLIQSHRRDLQEQYKVREIGIFGSFVRGEQRKRSDVDILVDFDEIPDLLKFIRLERYLESILKRKVDLVRKQAIRPELRDIVLQEVVYV